MKNHLPFIKSFLFLLFVLLALPLLAQFNASTELDQFSASVLSVEQKRAMDEHLAMEVKYNVKRGSRPPVDWSAVPGDAYEQGVIQIKLRPFMHKSMDAEYLYVDKSEGYVRTGNKALDVVNKAIGASQYLRRQDALYRVSPVSEKYRERHMAWGSHLWREITFDSKMDVIEAVKMFQALPEVEIAEPILIKKLIKPVESRPILNSDASKWTPNDPLYTDNQWHFHNTGQNIGQVGTVGWDVNAEAAWEIEKGNPNFIVAIIDEGVQFDHPDLAANMWLPTLGPEGTGTIPGDHGTHVGGTVAAVTNNGVGVAGLAGGDGSADSGVKLMTIDLFNGTHGLNTLGMNQYAADNGASITQNSWGYGSADYYQQSDLDGIDYFNANGGGDGLIGGITIFAAGNDNDNGNWWPAYYGYNDPDVMGAMAVASYDNQGVRSVFSNYGAWIDISAPGTDVASTAIADKYVLMSGTSMACPHVSGVAALIVSNTEGVLTNQELWDILMTSVRTDLYDINTGFVGQLGSGALDAAAALVEAQSYIGGVPRPDNFNANAMSSSQVNLSWDLNMENDDVLVAWAPGGNTIGNPVNGTIYSAGDVLPGGGTVLYVGGATSVSHTGLDIATEYSYKVFAHALAERQDSQGAWYQLGDYSNGKSALATTDCDVYSPPFAENFEEQILCWSQQYHTGNINWDLLNGAAQNGTYSVRFNGTAGGESTRLVTPLINFLGYTEATLTFWERRPEDGAGGNARRDELRVEYWNGTAWVEAWANTATTANWTQRTVTLPAAALIEDGRIAFRPVASTRAATTTHVDNINITASGQIVFANFSASPRTAEIGQTVTFSDASGGGTLNSWSWNFGAGADPATATGVGPHNVVYATAGQKTVSLTVNGDVVNTKNDYISVLKNPILPPRDLDHLLDGTNVNLTWLTPLIDEGWETYTDFALSFGNWTQHDIDGSATYGIQDVNFTNSGYTGSFILFNPSQTSPALGGAWEPRTGSKYAACFAATAPPNNDWIVSPKVSIKAGHSLSFWHKSITAEWGLERFSVGISTTGNNPADFSIITPGAYVESPITWTEYIYDLSAYAGQEIHIAIHCVSNDAFAFFVDDFAVLDGSGKKVLSMFDDASDISSDKVSDRFEFYQRAVQTGESVVAANSNKSYAGYKIYRNSVEVGSVGNEGTLTFNDPNLDPGTYYYSVTATYIDPANESTASNEIEVVIEVATPLYTLTLQANPVSGGNPTGGGDFIEGASVAVQANPNTGYDFVNWTVGGTTVSTNANFNYTMPAANTTLVANFVEASYIMGDLNNDGQVNILDAVIMVNLILANDYHPAGDFTSSGSPLTTADLTALINLIMSGSVKNNSDVQSETAYISLNERFISLESDGTVAAFLFEIIADNAMELMPEISNTDFELAYRVENDVLRAMVFSFENKALPADLANLIEFAVAPQNMQWGRLEAANISANEVELIAKTVTSADRVGMADLNLKVYPNPNTGQFNLDLALERDARIQLTLYDVMGRLVLEAPETHFHQGMHTISLGREAELGKGFYILRLSAFNPDNQLLIYTNEIKVMVE